MQPELALCMLQQMFGLDVGTYGGENILREELSKFVGKDWEALNDWHVRTGRH